MTNRNSNGGVGGLAREIQRRLADAQGDSGATAPAAPPAPPPPDNQGLRVTKDGQLVPPGQAVPRDADGNPVSFSTIPDATFHQSMDLR